MRSVLGRVRARATAVVMAWSPVQRRHAVVLALILALFLGHYGVWCLGQPFFIEDSGISFAFARNIATGLGAVPFAGGERVEGYSNALWTFLLAGLYVFRVDPFFAAKAMGAVFGAATLLLSWAIGHEARGGHASWPAKEADPGDDEPIPEWAPLVGPALLAASTQFTLWAASGLENSLFNFLLSLGIWRLCVEIRTGARAPWSALAFFLLTMTRPDGLGYAAVGLFARILGTVRSRQWAALPAWILVFATPYAAYNAVRYEYFGWWFPNTYYAKDKSETVKLLGWMTGGWKQFKDWAFIYGVVFAAPALVLSLLPLTGTKSDRWRKPLIALILGGLALGSLSDGRIPAKLATHLPTAVNSWWGSHVGRQWNAGVVYFLVGSAVLLGLLTLLRRGWVARGLLWGSFSAGVFFWVWSNGDWMKGFRWGSLVALPTFTLIGLGIGVLVKSIPETTEPLVQWLIKRLPATRHGWVLLALVLSGTVAAVYIGSVALSPAGGKALVENIKPFTFTEMRFTVPKRRPLTFLAAVPISVILGFTIGTLRQRLPAHARTWRGISAGAGFAVLFMSALALPNTWKSFEFANGPETSVNDVHRRANYMGTVAEKLDLDDITLLDVDMGAHMFFTRWRIGDLAGLIDVAMSRHKAQKSFIDDYIFTELRPTFAHVHGSWANQSKIPRNPKWKEQYLEITGYPSGKRGYHVGNHIRKDLVARTDYRGPADKQVDFAGGVTMAGWEVPSPEIAPGGKLYVHTWWIATPRKIGFRVLVFLKDDKGNLHSAEAAPAFDWYKSERWQADEYVEGSWYIPVPESLPQGDYDLGVVVLNQEDGKVLPTLGVVSEPVRFLQGEWVASRVVHVVTAATAMEKANQVLAESLELAKGGQCEAGRARFKDARRHIVRNIGWRDSHAPQVNAAVVACYVARADELGNPYGKSEAIARALRIEPTAPAALAAGEIVAQALYEEGMAARAADQPQAAYNAFLAALRADPRLSQARVHLEEARDLRLGISGKKPEKEPATKATNKAKVPPRKTPLKGGDGAGVVPSIAPAEGEPAADIEATAEPEAGAEPEAVAEPEAGGE